jgi:uncharacterized protein YbjT (DUF2867 family)
MSIYTITGASGHTGRIITNTLLDHGHQVRVVGRHSETLAPFVARGAEAFVGALDDVALLTQAFTGADAVYLLLPGDYTAPDMRASQNQMGQAITTALRAADVRYVVNLSSVGAHQPERTGPVLGLHDQEQRLNQLEGVNVLHLRPTFFMENLLGNIGVIKGMGVNGSHLAADVPMPLIATADIGAVAAQRLLSLDFAGKSALELLGPRDYTQHEVTAALGAAIGKPELPYVQFPAAAAIQGMTGAGFSADAAAKMVELQSGMNDGYVSQGVTRGPQNTTPTTIEEFAPIFAAIYTAG